MSDRTVPPASVEAPSPPARAGVPVALAAAARDEGPHVLEWIAYHRMIGFDPILIYDNGSTDQTTDILARLAAIGAVEHVRWSPPPNRSPQRSAYADAIARTRGGWIAFLDIDEYLWLADGLSVGAFVEDVAGDAAGVAIAWRTFGSGGREHYDPAPTIERFTRCGGADWRVNQHVKSIVRAEAVREMNIHAAALDGDYVNDIGQRVEIVRDAFVEPRSASRAQVNHYILRSREEYGVKIARGRGSRSERQGADRLRPDPDRFFRGHDRNEEADARMLPLVPALRREMAALRERAGIAPDELLLRSAGLARIDHPILAEPGTRAQKA